MSDKKRQKYLEALRRWEAEKMDPYSDAMQAICLTLLDRFSQARDLYVRAVQGYNSARRLWMVPGCPHWPAEAYVLANQPRSLRGVHEEVNAYNLDPRGDALVALYAYALLELSLGDDGRALERVPGLLRYPKYREQVYIGNTIAAIAKRQQEEFDIALANLVEAHVRKARYGELRSTPEGYISLAGMCLSKMALDRGLKIRGESEYLPVTYLYYLREANSH